MSKGRTLCFYGQSDDLCEIEGTNVGEPDEFGPGRGDMAQVKIVGSAPCSECGQPVDGKAGVIVTWVYTQTGTWGIGVAPLEEDGGMPDWPMRWGHKSYSATLEIDVPHGVLVTQIYPALESDD